MMSRCAKPGRTLNQRPAGIGLRFCFAIPSLLLVLFVAGCDKHVPIAGGYEILEHPNMGPDSHPGISLGYRGWEVVPHLDGHTFGSCQDYPAFVHDGMIVFLITLPDEDEDHLQYDISPQLCVMRGRGPPVMLSERILGHHIQSADDGIVFKLIPSASGVHVEFCPGPGPDLTGRTATSVHDISWAQLAQWLDEGQKSAPLIVKPLGRYRLLPPATQATTARIKR